MTIQPKVIPAQDPTSLSHDPGPLQPDLYVSAAAVLEQQNRATDAADKYQQALALDPNHRAALIGLARLQHRHGDVAGAIHVYQTALKAYPDDAVLLNDLGLCYARSGQSDSALAALQRAVELKPDSTLYRNNMAAVLVEASRSAEAVPLLAQTYGTAVAYYNVGYLLHQRGEDHAAVEHFSAALRANPSLTPARSMLDRLVAPIGEAARPPQSPDRSRLPSAAVTPMSPTPDAQSIGVPSQSRRRLRLGQTSYHEAKSPRTSFDRSRRMISTGRVSPPHTLSRRRPSTAHPSRRIASCGGYRVTRPVDAPGPGHRAAEPRTPRASGPSTGDTRGPGRISADAGPSAARMTIVPRGANVLQASAWPVGERSSE